MLPKEEDNDINNDLKIAPDMYNDFEEVDNDILEVSSNEFNETRDVKVLIVLPNNKQRLVTMQMPHVANEVKSVFEEVGRLLKTNDCRLDIYAVVDPDYTFDYLVEVNNSSEYEYVEYIVNLDIMNNNNSNNEISIEEDHRLLEDKKNIPEYSPKSCDNQWFYGTEENNFALSIGNEVEITEETPPEIEDVRVDIEDKNEEFNWKTIHPNNFYKSEPKSKESTSERVSSNPTVELGDSPMLVSPILSKGKRKANTPKDTDILTIYPPPPSKAGISINVKDYKCLSSGTFLNDIIIDFYLKYLANEVLSPEDRNRTHVFSSHFFTRLINPHATESDDNEDKMTIAKKRHAGVERWTKNVNIFEKDFIIVPVNEHAHWYLAIICFAHLVHNINESEYFVSGDEVQAPCILIFDSLSGSGKTRVTTILRQYLYHEYLVKMQEEKIFDYESIPTVKPEIPEQSNATDCGLFVLQYVENFFKSPIKNYKTPLRSLKNWFNRSVIQQKRRKIADLISELSKDYNKNKNVILPQLTFPMLLSSEDENDSDNNERKNKIKKRTARSSFLAAEIIEEKEDYRPIIKKKNIILSDSDDSDLSIYSKKVKPLSVKPLSDYETDELFVAKSKPVSSENGTIIKTKRKLFNNNETSTIAKRKTTALKNRPCSRSAKMVEMGQLIIERQKKKLKTSRTYNASSSRVKKEETSKKSQNTTEEDALMKSWMSSNMPTDKFYALSFESLINDSKLPPTLSFSKFKKMNKEKESTEKINVEDWDSKFKKMDREKESTEELDVEENWD